MSYVSVYSTISKWEGTAQHSGTCLYRKSLVPYTNTILDIKNKLEWSWYLRLIYSMLASYTPVSTV